jgi:hypothetical protein
MRMARGLWIVLGSGQWAITNGWRSAVVVWRLSEAGKFVDEDEPRTRREALDLSCTADPARAAELGL